MMAPSFTPSSAKAFITFSLVFPRTISGERKTLHTVFVETPAFAAISA
jgi:hypothetical protein